jgi:hypothetical protein
MAGLFVIVTIAPAQNCVEGGAGLVGWWPGDGSTADLSRTTNHGVLKGAVTYETGIVGTAFAFGTSSSAVRIPANPALDVGTGSGMTIELWINPNDITQRGPLVEWNNGVDLWGAHFWVLPDQSGFGLQPPSSVQAGPGQLYAGFTLVGQWYQMATDANVLVPHVFQHVALTYDKASGEGRIYRNGELVAQQSLGVFSPQTSYDLYLGQRPAGPPGNPIEAYQGLMDEVSIYNRALSQMELFAIYSAGAAGKCKTEGIRVGIRVSQVELFWSTASNATYQLQYRSSLTTNQWIPLGPCIRATSSMTSFYNTVPVGQPQRFYRAALTNCVP